MLLAGSTRLCRFSRNVAAPPSKTTSSREVMTGGGERGELPPSLPVGGASVVALGSSGEGHNKHTYYETKGKRKD